MTGFIAHVPPTAIAGETIANQPFFPDVETASVRAVGRFDGAVTADVLREAIIAAITHVNDQLNDWALRQQAAGHATLDAVPAPHVGGHSTRVHAYQRAIASAARAHVEDTRRAQATVPAGLGKDARVLESVGLRQTDHWRQARHAIADVMTAMRENVQLI